MGIGNDLLLDAFGRVREGVHDVVDGLSEDELAARPDGKGNSIAWLVWHLTRVADDHLADAAGTEQLWTSAGWVDRFRLPFDVYATGYGHSSEEVDAVRASGEMLAGYHDAVHEQALGYVRELGDGDFARIVDDRWDPPVTLAVRLVSVVDDMTKHLGQAEYVRGLLG